VTLRAGYYNAAKPRWRAVVRNDGYPWYVCLHEHVDGPEATRCARTDLAAIKLASDGKGPWPEGWVTFEPSKHMGL
jgi:hypothetical protein